MLKVDLLRTAGTIPQKEMIFNRQKEKNSIVKHAVDKILLQKNKC